MSATFKKLVLMFLTLLLMSTGVAQAAEKKAENFKTKKSAALSQAVYKKLQAIQVQIDADQYTAALQSSKALRNSKKKLSPYEIAQSWNLTAYVHYLKENYQSALKAYRSVLAQGNLPEALTKSTLKTMGQLYFTTEEYDKSLKITKQLMAQTATPSADMYMLLGQTYFQMQQYTNALSPVKKAVSMFRKQGKKPKEQWLLLLRVIYHEKGDFKNMRVVLEEMIRLYPKEKYLRALAGVYSELGDTKKQLTIMEAFYEQGQEQNSSQITNLANLYLLHGLPYKAAKVLDEGLNKSKRVKASLRNYRLLSQAWYQAREDEKSIPPMLIAAKMSDKGELFVRVAQSYQNSDRWQDAVNALRKGIKKGGLKRKDTAQLMLGMALFNQQKLKQARAHFENAQVDKRSRKAATQWLAYVESELKRKALSEETSDADKKS
ncbi:MAG: tetratricopeptide repeat protein [Arenicellales bacterium]